MLKRYDKEFKIEAVRLASEPGNTQAQESRRAGKQAAGYTYKGDLHRAQGPLRQPEDHPGIER